MTKNSVTDAHLEFNVVKFPTDSATPLGYAYFGFCNFFWYEILDDGIWVPLPLYIPLPRAHYYCASTGVKECYFILLFLLLILDVKENV